MEGGFYMLGVSSSIEFSEKWRSKIEEACDNIHEFVIFVGGNYTPKVFNWNDVWKLRA